jgi:hypothetical protein
MQDIHILMHYKRFGPFIAQKCQTWLNSMELEEIAANMPLPSQEPEKKKQRHRYSRLLFGVPYFHNGIKLEVAISEMQGLPLIDWPFCRIRRDTNDTHLDIVRGPTQDSANECIDTSGDRPQWIRWIDNAYSSNVLSIHRPNRFSNNVMLPLLIQARYQFNSLRP